jgi:hypothetical protein
MTEKDKEGAASEEARRRAERKSKRGEVARCCARETRTGLRRAGADRHYCGVCGRGFVAHGAAQLAGEVAPGTRTVLRRAGADRHYCGVCGRGFVAHGVAQLAGEVAPVACTPARA